MKKEKNSIEDNYMKKYKFFLIIYPSKQILNYLSSNLIDLLSEKTLIHQKYPIN
jgi:hypothetical protein